MKDKPVSNRKIAGVKKGYNEHNPGQPQGAFTPDAARLKPAEPVKSNTADKKAKEERN